MIYSQSETHISVHLSYEYLLGNFMSFLILSQY